MHVNHPQPIAYIKVHSWWCTFYGFGQIHNNIYLPLVREGNGTPLQYSCLENSTDGGAWWAAVHGVAMPSSHLILWRPLLLLLPIPPSIRVFSNESTLHMRWPKYWTTGISGLHYRLTQGVRPRLEGKQRTRLSSRLATRISWSPLSGLKGDRKSVV